jgi:hypothetical protein
VRSRTARVMTTLMRNGRDRRSGNPLSATRAKSACFCSGPISGSHQGQQPKRLHSKAGYMAAPERFPETSDSPLAPRAPSIHGTQRQCAAVQQVVGYWKCCGPSALLGRTAALDPQRICRAIARAHEACTFSRPTRRTVSLQSVGNLWAPTASDIEGPTDLDWVGLCFETEKPRCALDPCMAQERSNCLQIASAFQDVESLRPA